MEKTNLNQARELLLAGGYTCVLYREGKTRTTTLRGVKPLVTWLKEGFRAEGFSAADKVVGKATAFLYCLLGVKEVYAGVMSKGARDVLESHSIPAVYDELVENIINRRGEGICPFEAAVLDIREPEEAYPAILAKMQEMGIE